MNDLRHFFMEDWLESERFQAKFNFGESGATPRSLAEILELCELKLDDALLELSHLPLRDSPNWGNTALRKHVAALHPGATFENVLITTGTSEALFLLFRALKPKKVALIVPAFQLLYEIPQQLGASIVALPVAFDSQSVPFFDLENWLAILEAERPDVVVLNHPHNPSGLVLSRAELDTLTDAVLKWDAKLVADEHYRFLSEESGNFRLGQSLYRNHKNVFVTGSFIKCLGVPGLRLGWCVGEKNTLSKMQSEKNYITHTVSPIVEWVAEKVLRKTETPLFEQSFSQWKKRKNELKDFLSSSKYFSGSSPQGGLVCCVAPTPTLNEERFQKLTKKLFDNGLFLLPLNECFEMKRWNVQGPKNLTNGFAYRLGLGSQNFSLGLEILETAAEHFFEG